MKKFDRKRLKLSLVFLILIVIFIILISLDVFTFSKYETRMTTSSGLSSAIYLLNDTYQTIEVKLPEVIPSNNQYLYTFSVSNFNDAEHCETNLIYSLHIRTTTNMPITFDLFQTLDIEEAESYIDTDITQKDADGTYFRHIRTVENEMLYSEDKTDYYTLLITFPSDYNDASYNSNIEYIEINVNSRQKMSTDV